MNYDGLRKTYWRTQCERVQSLREKIVARSKVGEGRVVPTDDALTIGDGRRLNMAIMFIDISDFSSRPMETIEEQDLMLRVLNLFFTEMIRIAEDYGGVIEKNTGDGLMAYFEDGGGDPAEVGTKRAVACALSMMTANTHLINPILRATPTPELQFRVSINYGAITVARIGSPRRFNAIAAIGTAANFASKMLAKAKPGEIVIGEPAKQQLPLDWQILWTELSTLDTGWVYRLSGSPYPLYRYIGRWNELQGT